jgi:hypothetical protein
MDGTRPSICRSAGQDARKIYRKSNGTFAVAVEIAPNVIEFGRLVLVPDRTALDVYEDALRRARKALKTGLGASDVDAALAIFEAALDAAFEVLREAFKS